MSYVNMAREESFSIILSFVYNCRDFLPSDFRFNELCIKSEVGRNKLAACFYFLITIGFVIAYQYICY